MSYIHFTVGTRDFLEKSRLNNENLIITFGAGETMLIEEATGQSSSFVTPRSYRVIDSIGTLEEVGFFVLNHIPVTDQGKPIFEHNFKNRESNLEDFAGFVAFRLLKPLTGDTYIVLTEWTDRRYFEMWKESQSFKKAHDKKPATSEGPHIFSSASYVKTYHTRENDIDELYERAQQS